MYELGRRLKAKGVGVSIWLEERPIFSINYLKAYRWDVIRVFKNSIRYYSQKTSLPFGLSETIKLHTTRDVAIYPEVVNGNPLGVKSVARWILFTPGELSKRPTYGSMEKFFYWSKTYLNDLVPEGSKRLRLPLIHQHHYQNLGLKRRGTLVLIRKGRERRLNAHPSDAICIDGKSHEEISYLFNISEQLYSYDAHTAYLSYAVICGCVPIVVPTEGLTKEECYPDPEDRYGVAYGEEEVSVALRTRSLRLDVIAREHSDAEEDLNGLIKLFSLITDSRLQGCKLTPKVERCHK